MIQKKLILLIVCLCALMSNIQAQERIRGKGPFKFDLDYARFVMDDSLVFTEVYYAVREQNLTYNPDSSGYLGGAKMEAEIWQDSSMLLTRGWLVPHEITDTSRMMRGQTLVGIQSFGMQPGEYRICVRGYDVQDRLREDSLVFPLKIEQMSKDVIRLSDIELCTSIQQSADRNSMYYKNTLEVIPNPSMLYGVGLPILSYYLEIYNLLREHTKRDVIIRSTIDDALGKELMRQDRVKKRSYDSSVEVGTMNLSTLKSGTYMLHVAVVDSQGRTYARASKKFFVYKPLSSKEKNDLQSSADAMGNEYALMTEVDIDDEFSHLLYITTETERQQFEKLADVVAKRAFLTSFWKRYDERLPGSHHEFKEEYKKRIAFADEYFSTGLKRGWKTDRGRVRIVYGVPDEVERSPNNADSYPYEIWHYNSIQGGVIFAFVDVLGFSDYQLVHSTHRNELHNENWYQEYGQKAISR